MNIVIAPDSFKECLTAPQVAQSIASGIKSVLPEASINLIPMADGGEGTAEALVSASGGSWISTTAYDPLMRLVDARYGIFPDRKTAVIDMAEPSGLTRLSSAERNPAVTSTFGTGQLIKHALESGYKNIIVGLGGSATNDGGSGLATALGYRLLDAEENELPPGGAALSRLARIDDSAVLPKLSQAAIQGAFDVHAPLTGPAGATMVYGAQKGADTSLQQTLENALTHYGSRLSDFVGHAINDIPGSGAAGGLGAGLIAFAKAQLTPGVELIAQSLDLENTLQQTDWVITGEGCLDDQTMQGKVAAGVARLANKHDKPVFAIAGQITAGPDALEAMGISDAQAISPTGADWDTILENTPKWLEECAAAFARELL